MVQRKSATSVSLNFIRMHLIKKIFVKFNREKETFNLDDHAFIYFEPNIEIGKTAIDRFGKGNFYIKDQILPLGFDKVTSPVLVKAFKKLKLKQFFFYKEIEGKFQKVKPKNVNK